MSTVTKLGAYREETEEQRLRRGMARLEAEAAELREKQRLAENDVAEWMQMRRDRERARKAWVAFGGYMWVVVRAVFAAFGVGLVALLASGKPAAWTDLAPGAALGAMFGYIGCVIRYEMRKERR